MVKDVVRSRKQRKFRALNSPPLMYFCPFGRPKERTYTHVHVTWRNWWLYADYANDPSEANIRFGHPLTTTSYAMRKLSIFLSLPVSFIPWIQFGALPQKYIVYKAQAVKRLKFQLFSLPVPFALSCHCKKDLHPTKLDFFSQLTHPILFLSVFERSLRILTIPLCWWVGGQVYAGWRHCSTSPITS